VLDLKDIDLRSLAEALEDHSGYTDWWFDPQTGEVDPWPSDQGMAEETEEEAPDERGFVLVDPLPSRESYGDLEDFVERVADPRVRDLLERAIAGRGAFRRFKDTLFEFPELREAWFTFHDVRMERRAIEWLSGEGVIDEAAAERAIGERADPELPAPPGVFDLERIVRAVAADLRRLYDDRLRQVVLFGSWARGDAHPESDVDLLVVLQEVDSAWAEHDRMDEVLWRHSFENDAVISALPVAASDFEAPTEPVVERARREGRIVA
jgi:hypothetical protein